MSFLTILKKNKEYRKVYSQGRSVADRHIVIYCYGNGLEFSRFGFTVSKKVGKAVIRNRIRRLFKEVCRLNNDKFPVGYDYILLARKDSVGLNYSQIEEIIMKLLRRIKNNRG